MNMPNNPSNNAVSNLSHVHDFHKLMNEKDMMLVYCGDFSQDLNKTLLSFTERKFKSENIEDNTRRKIFNIMVEMLQNISKNKIEKSPEIEDVESTFILGANENDYILVSSNMIRKDKIAPLRERLEQVNSLDKEGLKQLYKDVRLNSSLSDKSGAGIGIIDIARKSENKLGYNFGDISANYSVFSLLIRVSK
ncbi:MAG TPA: SiaB family protein kinase, partial [Bacteroidales bacterium]|nr:SiaB family protein kinase [Bacteroidales bacterium]